MLMNYHELTMSESRDSPERRKQFLLICVVMLAALVHSIFQADAFGTVAIEEVTFPGGEFVYKQTRRDYAASNSLEKNVAKDDLGMKAAEYIDNIFTLYLDDPKRASGRRQRFATGLLIHKKDNKEKKQILMATNEGKQPITDEEFRDLGAIELWPRLEYHARHLPSVKAASVDFTSTGGFVSSLILSMKIMPALRKYAAEHSNGPVTILSTCSTMDNVCTHYAPLEKGKEFLLGNPDTDAFLEQMGPEETLSFGAIFRSAKKFIPPLAWVFPEKEEGDASSDEL